MPRLYVCWMFRVPSASISPIKNPESYQHSRLVSSSITSRCFVSQICNLSACWSKLYTPSQTSEQLNRACSWKYTDCCNNWEILHCWTGLRWYDAKHVCLSSLRPWIHVLKFCMFLSTVAVSRLSSLLPGKAPFFLTETFKIHPLISSFCFCQLCMILRFVTLLENHEVIPPWTKRCQQYVVIFRSGWGWASNRKIC